MIFKFGEFYFDSKTLILYRKSANQQIVKAISEKSERNNDIIKIRLKQHLSDMNSPPLINPIRAGICLTNNCNFSCTYCIESATNLKGVYLSTDNISLFIKDVIKKLKIQNLIKRSVSNLEVSFTGGGEPTYYWNLFENAVELIQDICLNNNIQVAFSLVTNGFLNNRQCDFIVSKFNKVTVSYDGLPEIQNKNRKTYNEKETSFVVEKTIRYLLDKGVPTSLRTTLWYFNCCNLKKMAQYISENFDGISEWVICPTVYEGRAKKYPLDIHDYEKFDFASAFLDLKEAFPNLNISSPIFTQKPCSMYCGSVLSFSPWLLPNKKITSCIDAGENMTIVGEVRENAVIYYDNVLQPAFLKYFEKYNSCNECLSYCFCRGGCPIRHLRNNGNGCVLNEWECNMVNRYWKRIITNTIKYGKYNNARMECIHSETNESKNIYSLMFL